MSKLKDKKNINIRKLFKNYIIKCILLFLTVQSRKYFDYFSNLIYLKNKI